MKSLFRVYRGYLRRREDIYNDNLQVAHMLAWKINQAFGDGQKFAEPIEPVKLLTDDPGIESTVKMANNFNMSRDTVEKQIIKEVLESE